MGGSTAGKVSASVQKVSARRMDDVAVVDVQQLTAGLSLNEHEAEVHVEVTEADLHDVSLLVRPYFTRMFV